HDSIAVAEVLDVQGRGRLAETDAGLQIDESIVVGVIVKWTLYALRARRVRKAVREGADVLNLKAAESGDGRTEAVVIDTEERSLHVRRREPRAFLGT